MVFASPCYPCKYNAYATDEETGDPIFDECHRPEGGFCWIEAWMEEDEKKEAEKCEHQA